MKRKLTMLLAALLLLSGITWAQTRGEEVYSTCRFGASYNPNNTSYTGTFTVTNGDYTWTVGNGNNNNNGWTNGDGYGQVKFGRKNTASVGYITTDAAYSEAVTKVELTIDAFTNGKVNSVKLYTGTSTTSMTEAGSFAVAVGTQTVALSTPATGLYYKIEFDCAAGSANGLITVSKVEYYHSTGGNPVVVAPTFTPNGGSFLGSQEVSIACATDGATIYYTLDGSTPTTSSAQYTAPFTLNATTTVKAFAVKANYDNSEVTTAVFTKETPMTVAEARAFIDNLNGATSDDVYVEGIISQIDSYNSTYHSIYYWISDDGTTTDQLEVYSGKGLNGADFNAITDLILGSTVIVKGKVKLYNNTLYEFIQNSQIVSLTLPSTPYISADDIDIAYNATSGEIEYTLNNPVTNGSLSVSENVDWISNAVLNTTGSKVTFSCEANPNAGSRSGVVTITYSYGNNVTSKEVTVTQAGNPNLVDNISDITEVGTAYSVRGTVVAINSKGFVMGDGTGYVYYYKNGAPTQSVNDMVSVSGTTGTYGQIIQFTNTATVAEATTSNYNGTPAATVITTVPDYSTGYHLSTYLEFEGALTKSNSSYYIALGESQIQISYPTSAQGTALTALDGKQVLVKGYFTGINSSSKFTVMLESVEEVTSSEPSITIANATVSVPAAGAEGTLEVVYANIDEITANVYFCDAEGAATTYDWITAEMNDDDNLDYFVSANEGEARTAYLMVNVGDVYSNLVTINQAQYVVDYATLPFEFDGGRADIANTNGLTQNGLDSDYSNSPKLKFKTTGTWVLLHFNEVPGTLTYTIKGNSFSGGTFTVQTSEDGVTYTDLQTYTQFGETGNTAFNESFENIGTNVRYIKWIYVEKSSGNVGLGNIVLYEEGGGPVIETYDLTVEPVENLEIFTYIGDDLTEPLEGAGTLQVQEGTNVMLSVSANEGYILQSLIVDGVNHVNDIEDLTYSFTMPDHNVTISATAVEDIPFEPVTYTLATTVEPGKTYIIVGSKTVEEETNYYAMGGQNNNNRAAVEIGVDGTTATVSTADVFEFVINTDESESDLFNIYDPENNGYLYAAGGTGSNNYLRVQTELTDNGRWTIAFDETTGSANITAQGDAARNIIRYNSTNNIFSCYASGQNDIYLYVKDETTNQTQTISFVSGVNWFSTNLEITLNDLEDALVATGLTGTIKIKAKTQTHTYNGSSWRGALTWDVARMYIIDVPADCQITLSGMPINPADHPVNIVPGTNWIAFPLNESMQPGVAFAGFGVKDDMVKSKNGSTKCLANGSWRGTNFPGLEPWKGYLYNSAATTTRPFVFPTPAKGK